MGQTRFKGTPISKIPEDWKIVRLEEACGEITDGSHYSPKEDKNGEFRIATVANIVENKFDIDSCKKISKEDYECLVRNGCKPQLGDVLFSKDGTVGLSFSFKQDIDIALLSSIAIIRPKEILHSDYCAFTLKSPLVFRQIIGSKRGTGLRRIILKDLKRIKIPLPPLPEQKKIAEVLSTVDEGIGKVDQAIERTRRVKKGLMQQLLTKGIGHTEFRDTRIGRIPRKWEVARVSDICEVKGGKRLPKGHKLVGSRTAHPYIRVVDFRNMSVDTGNLEYLAPETHEFIRRYTISLNDVYISIAGTVGLVGIIPRELDGANLTENAAKLCNLRNITKDFLAYFLNSVMGINQISALVGKAQQPKLALFRIEKIGIPLPPIPEQDKITGIVSTVDKMLELLGKKKEKLERIKKGLMNDLLTGKKRVRVEK